MVRVKVQRKWLIAYTDNKVDSDAAMLVPCRLKRATWAGVGAHVYPRTVALGLRLTRAFAAPPVFEGAFAAELQESFAAYKAARANLRAATLPAVPGEKVESWEHQRRGFWFAYLMPSFLLSEKVGFGKTKQFFDVICNADMKRVLVITTSSAVGDWPLHHEKHSTKPYKVLALDEKAGTSVDKAEEIRAALTQFEYLLIVLSYDTCYRPPLGANGKNEGLLCQVVWDIVLADELHNASSPNGRRSNFLYDLGKAGLRRGGATGSVVRHKPEDIWAQFRFLDVGIFGDSFADFKERYCVFNIPSRDEEKRRCDAARESIARLEAAGEVVPAYLRSEAVMPLPRPRFVVGYKNLDEMRKLLHSITFHVEGRLEGVPEPRETIRRCFMSEKAEKVYDEIEAEFVTVLEDDTVIDAENVLTRMIRMQQVTGGFIGESVADEETGKKLPSIVHHLDDAKEALLCEVLEEIGDDEKIVVAYQYRANLEAIVRAGKSAGRRVFQQNGQSHQHREFVAYVPAEGEKAPILAGHEQSTCEAIDLTCSAYLVCFALGFSLYRYVQLIGRLDRPGQKQSPTVIHLCAAGTIDERKYKGYVSRQEIADAVLTSYGVSGETVTRLRRAIMSKG